MVERIGQTGELPSKECKSEGLLDGELTETGDLRCKMKGIRTLILMRLTKCNWENIDWDEVDRMQLGEH